MMQDPTDHVDTESLKQEAKQQENAQLENKAHTHPRRGVRERRAPKNLTDFVCY